MSNSEPLGVGFCIRLDAETAKQAALDASRHGMPKSARMRTILRRWYALPRMVRAAIENWDGTEPVMIELPRSAPGATSDAVFGATG